MLSRTSHVKSLNVISAIIGSTIQIGDCTHIDGTIHALAVQRNSARLYPYDNDFKDYDIFSEPSQFPMITEPLQICYQNPHPRIDVDHIHVTAASTSSVIGIGNTRHVHMISRIKHIRQIYQENGTDEGETSQEIERHN